MLLKTLSTIYEATAPYVAPGLLSLPFNLVNLAAAKLLDRLDPIV